MNIAILKSYVPVRNVKTIKTKEEKTEVIFRLNIDDKM